MKLKLILFTVLPFTLCAQTRNYDQEFGNLLFSKQMTEVQSYYAENKNNITHPFVLDSYQLISNIYSEKTDSVLLQFPVFISNYYGTIADGNLLLFLPTFYGDLGEYSNGLKMLDILETFFTRKQNEGQKNENILKNAIKLKKHYESMSRLPKMEICNANNAGSIHIPIQTDPLVIFEAQYNQISLRTIFDTGTSYYFITQKNYAEKARIKMIEPYSEILFNGKEIRFSYGMLDSICIGSLSIKNIPILIAEDDRFFYKTISDSLMNEDKLSKADSMSSLMEVIMGLPMIKMLNYVSLDLQKNDLSISLNHRQETEEESNIYIENMLYLRSKINGLDFTVFVDTGGNLGDTAVIISNHFYQNHVELFSSLSSNVNKTVNSNPSVPIANAFNIQIGNGMIDLFAKVDFQFPYVHKNGGYIGLVGLLKKLKQVTFDFKSMRMDCE